MDIFSKNKFLGIINYLTGKTSGFSLEGQIFHSICLLGFIALGVTIPINYWIGLNNLVLILLIVVGLLGIIYYYSRFKGKLAQSIIVFQFSLTSLTALHYLYNNGISGPFYGVFMLSFLVTVAIMPKKQYVLWLSINLCLLLVCLYIDYLNPTLIVSNYDTLEKKFFDHGLSYFIVMSLLFFMISTIKDAYNKQHLALDQKARDLEKSNQTKNKLISILSHDLKEPLNSIQGFLELINEVGLSEEEKTTLEQDLLKRTKETSYMLSNMLSWSKNQMAEAKPELVQLPLKSTLYPTLNLLGNIAQEKGISVEIMIDDQACVIGDRDMLQLVVRNLFMNAIKFTYTGGLVIVNSEVTNNHCIIKIIDNGPGISAEVQEHLFSLDTKASYGTAKEKGAGLGLVLCKEYIELQNGEIGFNSKKGEGSEFFIILPLCKKGNTNSARPLNNPIYNITLV